jgi:hypothetical protein
MGGHGAGGGWPWVGAGPWVATGFCVSADFQIGSFLEKSISPENLYLGPRAFPLGLLSPLPLSPRHTSPRSYPLFPQPYPHSPLEPLPFPWVWCPYSHPVRRSPAIP